MDGALVTHRPIHKYVPCLQALPLYGARSNIVGGLVTGFGAAEERLRSEASDKK